MKITTGALLTQLMSDITSDDPLGNILRTATAVKERVREGAKESLQVDRADCFTPRAELPAAATQPEQPGEIPAEGETVDESD